MKITTIVFDIGNVLTLFVGRDYIHSFGFDPQTEETVYNATVGGPYWKEYDRGILTEEEILERFLSLAPGCEAEVKLAMADVRNVLLPVPYAIPWIQELKERGYRVPVLSNISAKVLRDCAYCLDFLTEVQGGILSYEERMIKPDADIFLRFLEKLQVHAEECVFLDDTLANIETAKTLGFHTIHFTGYDTARAELEALLAE